MLWLNLLPGLPLIMCDIIATLCHYVMTFLCHHYQVNTITLSDCPLVLDCVPCDSVTDLHGYFITTKQPHIIN